MQKYNSRAEVPDKYKWDLSEFFENDEQFNEAFNETKDLIIELSNYKGCTKDSKRLYEFLIKETKAIADWEDLFGYAMLVDDQELGIPKSIERKNRGIQLNAELNKNISFFAPELLELTQEEYDKLFEENSQLNEFKADLDRIYREKEHILSENEEKIIAELGVVADKCDDMSSNLINRQHDYGKLKLEDGSEVEIATNNYRKLMKNKDVKIRKKIYNSFNKTLKQYSGISADILNNYVTFNDKVAKLHHFANAWEAKLFSLNMPKSVYDNLVNVTETNVKPLQKYINLKKKVLGLKKYHLYDNALDLVDNEKEYTIEEAQELVFNALKPLGQSYLDKYKKIIDKHYIDYCQYKGKCNGGYSFAALNHDSRIMMNFNYDLESVSTIAHESGHNVHHQFLMAKPVHYRQPSNIICEVMSLTNECLLSNYLVKNGETKAEKLAGLENILGVVASNLFGTVREGKMELDMYNVVNSGGTLTNELLSKMSYDSLKKYYGKTIEFNEMAGNGWITRSHYYMNFYLFSYAICICVACNVAERILNNDEEMLEKYYAFMQTGSDVWPIDAFKILGFDLTKPDVYLNAINYFDSLVKKFESIYKEMEV